MKSIIFILPFLLFLSSQTSAQTAPNIQEIRISLDSVWVVWEVFWFFYAGWICIIESGSVRSKNTVNVLMKNYMDTCIGGLVFWLFGLVSCLG
jgi:Amt family ammonium transporter